MQTWVPGGEEKIKWGDILEIMTDCHLELNEDLYDQIDGLQRVKKTNKEKKQTKSHS